MLISDINMCTVFVVLILAFLAPGFYFQYKIVSVKEKRQIDDYGDALLLFPYIIICGDAVIYFLPIKSVIENIADFQLYAASAFILSVLPFANFTKFKAQHPKFF